MVEARDAARKHNMNWDAILEGVMVSGYDNTLYTLTKYFEVETKE